MKKKISKHIIWPIGIAFGILCLFLTFGRAILVFSPITGNSLDFSKELYIGNERLNAVDYKLEKDKSASASISAVFSNKTLRWGIARKPNNQTPDADPGTPALLAKYGAKYVGDTSKKVIYLTFDEGYENGYTPKILDTLKENNVKAIFFITGPYLKNHEDLVTRMIEEGHEVGNHTINHPSLPSKNDTELKEEISKLNDQFKSKYSKDLQFLRPPMGEYSERTLYITRNMGYCNLFWSFAYDDWHKDISRGAQYTINMVEKNLHNGAVLLLHAVSKDNADALDAVIKNSRAKGYEFGAPQELLEGFDQ